MFDEAHVFADHRLARYLGLCGQRDEYIRTQAEAEFVSVGGRTRIEECARRPLQPDAYFGRRERQTFSSADKEGDARPSTILDLEPCGHIGLNS